MSTHFGILGGKPPATELQQLRTELELIKARVTLLEHNNMEDHLTTSQHRTALVDMRMALDALSVPPVKFTAEQQKVWNEAAKRLEKK